MKMKRLFFLTLMLSAGIPAHGQLTIGQTTPVYIGEATALSIQGGEVFAAPLQTSLLSYVDLRDVSLSAGRLSNLRLYGDNRLSVDTVHNIYCLGGISELLISATLTGLLSERDDSYLTSTTGSTMNKTVTLSPSLPIETGLGFSLQSDRSQSQTIRLHFVPVYRQGKASIARVLALSTPTALRAAQVSLFPSRATGIPTPHLYYSPYGLENWKPADESHYTAASNKDEALLVAATALPLVAGITIFDEPSLFFPAALTPNGDGINDRFEIAGGKNYQQSRLVVTTRSGQVVFDKSPYLNDFDGNGLPAGTYYYIYYTDKTAQPTKKATLTLLK